MRFRGLLIGLGVLATALVGGWFAIGPDWRGLITHLPTNKDVLFWSTPQRDAAFRMLDQLPLLAKASPIAAGGPVRALAPGKPLGMDAAIDAFMKEDRVAGLVILQDGQLREERYGLGFSARGRWTSFSVAKSLTSTLVGAAIADRKIKSLDDKVSTYIPEMKGSAYDDVTIAQLLSMTSGVAWNEDYEDPNSDVAKFNAAKPDAAIDATVSYMRKLPRAVPPGTRWNYSTGETNLVGVLVSKATGQSVSSYLSEKIWKPYGMEAPATWLQGATGHEISGCCIQAATRDFARFGQFILEGGKAAGKPVLPADWIAQATTKQADIGKACFGYGRQWWTWDDGAFEAQGIFGQGIFIDPARRLVIAVNADWERASGPDLDDRRNTFYKIVRDTLDAEARARGEATPAPLAPAADPSCR